MKLSRVWLLGRPVMPDMVAQKTGLTATLTCMVMVTIYLFNINRYRNKSLSDNTTDIEQMAKCS